MKSAIYVGDLLDNKAGTEQAVRRLVAILEMERNRNSIKVQAHPTKIHGI